MRAGIALGSNLGDRLRNLKTARQRVEHLAGVEPPLLASSVYETEPVEMDPDAGMFLNAVIEIGYSGAGDGLLRQLQEIEHALGRPALHSSTAPRTLDLDLLYLGELVLSLPQLELPHPRLCERRFVLEPLAEIRPDLVLPWRTENVAALLHRLGETRGLVRAEAQW